MLWSAFEKKERSSKLALGAKSVIFDVFKEKLLAAAIILCRVRVDLLL